MKRSASVTLTLAVTLGAARAQQYADPCDAATFNAKVCQSVVSRGSYCSQGTPVTIHYQQPYPYYYDRYRSYTAQGGAVNPSRAEPCRHGAATVHGGFGATAASHGGESKAGG
jgi:hypothetical protein